MCDEDLRKTWAELMVGLARADADILTIVGDISHGILQPFANEFPRRYYNIGICEPSMISLAAGLSHVGFIPFVHTIAPFLIERAFEQIKLDFGYQRLPVNLVSVGGSFDYGQLGCSHHSYADVAMVMSIEGSKVFLPSSSIELSSLMKAAYSSPGVKYYRLTENPHGIAFREEDIVEGRAIKVRDGKDVTLIALGPQLKVANEVAQEVAKDVSVELIYVHSMKPFDDELIRSSINKTKSFVTVEELSSVGGLHHRVLRSVAGVPFHHGVQISVDKFVTGYGSHSDLMKTAGISKESLRATVQTIARKVL